MRAFSTRTSMIAATAGLVLSVLPNIGSAEAATRVAWVWGNCPTCTSAYTPSTTYSYNSASGAVTITPTGTGAYTVDFAKLGAGSLHKNNVQVTAYSSSGYCTSAGWDSVGPQNSARMYVRCFDAAGNAANSYFTLNYQARTTSFGNANKGIAFIWADQPSSASYTPNSFYNYNSTGVANTVTRSGTGVYAVDIHGLSPIHSDVQVTAYSSSAARCKVSGWGSDGSTGTSIGVRCFNSAGAPSDMLYSLSYAVREGFGDRSAATTHAVFAWANQPTSTTAYVPSTSYQYNEYATGHLKAVKNSTGFYTVTVPGSLSYNHSDVLVTGYGSSSNYCNVSSWGTAAVNVACYAQGGGLVDDYYDVAFQHGQ